MTSTESPWEPLPCVKDAILEIWPEGLGRTPKNKGRMQNIVSMMRRLQIELIYCHWPDMDEVTQTRAKKTLIYLEHLG